jgi:hypothetical protein
MAQLALCLYLIDEKDASSWHKARNCMQSAVNSCRVKEEFKCQDILSGLILSIEKVSRMR